MTIKNGKIDQGQEFDRAAFGELLVGQLYPQFQGSFEYTVSNTELNNNTTANGGTVTQALGMAVAQTSTTTASSALFESRRHAKYKAGLGGLARFTALFTTPVAVTEQYIGIMDEIGSTAAFANGYAVGYDGTTFGLHRFQNDAKITISQANWDDPLDGNGHSGMTLDQTKLNVFAIRYQYLGAGAIQYLIESDTTGEFFIFHTEDYPNKNTEPSTHNPNYHFAIWVDNKATTSNLIIKSSSYAYFIEGKTNFIELHQPDFSSNIRQKAAVTTEVAIFTIRNKTTYASKTNFIDIVLINFSTAIQAIAANNLGRIRIVKNATLGGTPSYVDINATNSVVEIDVAGTTVTGGTQLFSGLLAGKNDKFIESLFESKFIIGPGETITLSGESVSSATIDGSLVWRELF